MIKLNKAIYTLLSGSTSLVALVGTNIFPVIIPENTVMPCLVYDRTFSVQYTKDYNVGSISTVNITILADSYSEAITIADLVDTRLCNYQGTVDDINIVSIRLVNGDENFQEDCFIQQLQYEIICR